jgi:hypothetical protein
MQTIRFFEQRERQERAAAERSTDKAVRHSHERLARYYRALIDQDIAAAAQSTTLNTGA